MIIVNVRGVKIPLEEYILSEAARKPLREDVTKATIRHRKIMTELRENNTEEYYKKVRKHREGCRCKRIETN